MRCVGTAPTLGIGTPLLNVPANVQTVRAAELDVQHRATLTDFFAANLQSVTIPDGQGNPYQTDVNYRRFMASPQLGTPQELSVFEEFFNGPNHTFDGAHPVNEQFVGPGAPRGEWVGVRYAWD